MLNQYKNRQKKELHKYQELEKELNNGISEITEERARFLKATIRRGIYTAQASIKWCEETMLEFKK